MIRNNSAKRLETFRQTARTFGIGANREVFDLERQVSRGSPERSNQGTSRAGRRASAGDERDELQRKAQQDEIALRLIEWVTSPGQLPRPEDLVPIRTHRLRRK